MTELELIRRDNPEFAEFSDEELAPELYQDYGQGMSQDQFYHNIGFDPSKFSKSDYQSENEAVGTALARAPGKTWELVKSLSAIPSMIRHPIDTAENIAYGTAKNTSNIVNNLAQNISGYIKANQEKNIEKLQQKAPFLVEGYKAAMANPEQLDILAEKLTPSKANRELNREWVESLRPSNESHAGAQAGQSIGEWIPSAVITSAAKVPALAPILHGASENKNVYEDLIPLLTGKQIGKAALKHAPAAAKIAQEAGKETIKGMKSDVGKVKETIKAARKPGMDLEVLQEKIRKGSEKKHALKTQDIQETRTAAEDIGQLHGNAVERHQRRAQEIEKYAPDVEAESRLEARKNLIERNESNKLGFNQEYKELFDTKIKNKNGKYEKIGSMESTHHRGASEPVDYEHIKNAYKAGYDALEKKGFWKNSEIEKLNLNNVEQLNTLRRHISSEAIDYAHDEKMADTSAKRTKAGTIKKDLQNLAAYLDNIVETTLPDNAYKKLKDIDSRYGKIIHPFREQPFLRNAIDKNGNITSKNIFKELNDIGNPQLLKNLLEHPGFLEAMTKHDLRGLNTGSPEIIYKLLNSDQGRALPLKVKQQLEAQVKDLQDAAIYEKFKTQLQASEIKALMNEPEIKKVLKNNPDLLKKLHDIHTIRTAIKDLALELEKLGMDKDMAQKKADKFNNYFKIAAGVASVPLLKSLWGLITK